MSPCLFNPIDSNQVRGARAASALVAHPSPSELRTLRVRDACALTRALAPRPASLPAPVGEPELSLECLLLHEATRSTALATRSEIFELSRGILIVQPFITAADPSRSGQAAEPPDRSRGELDGASARGRDRVRDRAVELAGATRSGDRQARSARRGPRGVCGLGCTGTTGSRLTAPAALAGPRRARGIGPEHNSAARNSAAPPCHRPPRDA